MMQFLFVMVTWIGLMHNGSINYQVVYRIASSEAQCVQMEIQVRQVMSKQMPGIALADKAMCIPIEIPV